MRAVPACILIAVLSISSAQESTTDGRNDKLNSIETKPNSERLDPYIRKALLKALSELEESSQGDSDNNTEDSAVGGTLIEPLPTAATKEGIQIHSFVVNGQSAFSSNSTNTPTLIDNNISILSTTIGNVENQLSSAQPTFSPYTEIIQTRASGNIYQRSIEGSSKGTIQGSTKGDPQVNDKTTTLKPKSTSTTPTTTTTTTTTTPKPTHNDDGENIEEVNKQDVQVYSAPLVAAFTVHQDAQGQPKQVIPIYQQSNNLNTLSPLSPAVPTPSKPIVASQINQPDFITQQLALQRQLEEKQRYLEEQLRLLLVQQREQEELLRNQHFLLQQKEIQRQSQFNAAQIQTTRQPSLEQKLPTTSPANFQIQKSIQQPIFGNPNPTFNQLNNQVLIQSSVPLEQDTLVPNHQQLPNREAVDFLLHLRNQSPQQFPLQENHLPQGIGNFLQPNPVPPVFHHGVNLNQVRPIGDLQGNKQNTRVFRQEIGVGNFGLNNQNQNFNRYNIINPVYTNRFFPVNRPNTYYNADAELKHLLSQNLVNARGHEDINIVSKVLSLNHGIPINNHVSNRLPFDSRRHA